MGTKKAENYTAGMVERLREVYDAEATEEQREEQVRELSEELGKNPKSIRAKLVSLGVYVKKAYKAKTGEKPETKEDIVRAIATITGVDADANLPGLQNAGKNALVFLRTWAQVASDALAEKESESA